MSMNLLEPTDRDVEELEQVSDAVVQSTLAYEQISRYGVDKASLTILTHPQFMSSVSLTAIALESHRDHALTQEMALEQVENDIEEKKAKWSAKLLSFFSKTASHIGTVIKNLMTRMETKSKEAKEKMAARTEKVKAKIKAHPYTTIATALLAVAAVIGIVVFATANVAALKDIPACQKFNQKLFDLISAIKWPFGKIVPVLKDNGKKIAIGFVGVSVVAAAVATTALGWSKQSIEHTEQMASKSAKQTESLWGSFKTKSVHAAQDIWTTIKYMAKGTVQGARAATYRTDGEEDHLITKLGKGVVGGGLTLLAVTVVGVTYLLYKLIKTIVVGTFRAIASTYGALAGEEEHVDDEYI